MIKRIAVSGILAFIAASSMFSTDFDECFGLNNYFNYSREKIRAKITEYEQRLIGDPKDYYADLAIGILYTALSSSGENPDITNSRNIVSHVEKFLNKEKENPFAMVYLGLGHSLVSRDSKDGLEKFFEVNNAISIFDNAVRIAGGKPIEWFVRYQRANLFINLPDFFKKRDIAAADYDFVQKAYSENSSLEGYMIAAYYFLGELQKSKTNIAGAVDYWDKSVSLNKKLNLNVHEAVKAQNELDIFNPTND